MKKQHTTTCRRRQRGVTAIEYALIGVLISIAIIASARFVGETNQDIWTTWVDAFTSAVAGAFD